MSYLAGLDVRVDTPNGAVCLGEGSSHTRRTLGQGAPHLRAGLQLQLVGVPGDPFSQLANSML